MAAEIVCDKLRSRLQAFEAETFARERLLTLYALTVTAADHDLIGLAATGCRERSVPRAELYEVNLQSYLFLGFPRMLLAAEALSDAWPGDTEGGGGDRSVDLKADEWYRRGGQLCRRVYNHTYAALERRVTRMAPEVFDWMLLEGYGKVLSRPDLDVITREFCIVAFLMAENYPRQLHSHLRGALNVGADHAMLRAVVDEVGQFTPPGLTSAISILKKLNVI